MAVAILKFSAVNANLLQDWSIIMYLSVYLVGFLNGGLKHQGKYYATVTAVNKLGQMVSAFSAPIVVDDTPPKVYTFIFYLLCYLKPPSQCTELDYLLIGVINYLLMILN